MIPRYLRIVYWTLLGGILLMLLLLIYGCERKHSRIVAMRDESRIAAPTDLPDEEVSIALANDADGSVRLDPVSLRLPQEPSLGTRVILERMLADLARPASTHPLPAGPAVTDVFLLALPLRNASIASDDGFASGQTSPYGQNHLPGAQLAVVNLTKAFADAHPSGIEAEDLTLRAVIATVHANLTDVEQVRFLVDGVTRPTLSGHADLSHPYSVADPLHLIHTLSPLGEPQ